MVRRQSGGARRSTQIERIMTNEVKASVIVPVYGSEDYLPQCLDSLCEQTLHDIEIVVVDDCSPGNCEEIVRIYQQQDDRIRYVRHAKNEGTLRARIHGVEASCGPYVVFVDSDDRLHAAMMETMYKAALQHIDADILMCCAHIVDEQNLLLPETRQSMIHRYGEMSGRTFSPLWKMARHNDVVWGKWISRSLCDRVSADMPAWDIRYGEDVLQMFFCYYRAQRVVALPDRLVHYRIHRKSEMQRHDVNTVCGHIRQRSAILRYIWHFLDRQGNQGHRWFMMIWTMLFILASHKKIAAYHWHERLVLHACLLRHYWQYGWLWLLLVVSEFLFPYGSRRRQLLRHWVKRMFACRCL